MKLFRVKILALFVTLIDVSINKYTKSNMNRKKLKNTDRKNVRFKCQKKTKTNLQVEINLQFEINWQIVIFFSYFR